jgi:hypothetical protein
MNMPHKYSSTVSVFFNLRQKREVRGQLHALALLPGTEPPVRLTQETMRAPEAF